MKKIIRTLLKLLGLLIISIGLGTLIMTLLYSIPVEKIEYYASDSSIVYKEQKIEQWAGNTRYSHISNLTDSTMIDIAICRPYDSTIKNALLNPYYEIADGESFANIINNKNEYNITTFARYWHGYLIYIIPSLLVTNAGGIRTIMMFVQFLLSMWLLYLLGKRNILYMLIYSIVVLFINPVTTVLTYHSADIYVLMMIFSIAVLLLNDWLKQNNRYILFFALNGIIVCFIDFFSYPLVAWGIPLSICLLINKDDFKSNILHVITYSLAWIFGYAGMWSGKFIVATLLTDVNVIEDGFNQVFYRMGGDGYTFVEVLRQIWESVNDVPMLLLYLIGIIMVLAYSFKNKLKFNISKQYLLDIIPHIIIGLGPLVWYFVVRNHCYVHPWFEYRESAILVWIILLVFSKTFIKEKN